MKICNKSENSYNSLDCNHFYATEQIQTKTKPAGYLLNLLAEWDQY
jgi:hypothetical protein